MMNDFFGTVFSTGPLTWGEIFGGLIAAFVLSFAVAWTYRNTHKGLSYSQSFTFALILVGVLVSAIMMVIGNNIARAFGAFGTLSLIRFRTAIKDPKDIAFILLSVAVGMAAGTRNYGLALATTVFSLLIIYYLTRVNFGTIRKYDYILHFTASPDKFSNEKLRGIFDEFLKYNHLLNVTSRDSGRALDYTFNIKFITGDDIEKFTSKLSQAEGVANARVLSSQNDIEY